MKTTLENSYACPKTEKDFAWIADQLPSLKTSDGARSYMASNVRPHVFGKPVNFGDFRDTKHRKEISFEQYLDLLNDRITPWRLAEIGFVSITLDTCKAHQLELAGGIIVEVTGGGDVSAIERDEGSDHIDHMLFSRITTLAQLQNLISYI